MPFDPTLDPLAELPVAEISAERPPPASVRDLLAQAQQTAAGQVRPCRQCGCEHRETIAGRRACRHCGLPG